MEPIPGDTDIAVLADQGRARMVFALGDGRALAATTLAAEAGVSAASVHLAKLADAGLIDVGPTAVTAITIEALARVARPARTLPAGRRPRACHVLRPYLL